MRKNLIFRLLFFSCVKYQEINTPVTDKTGKSKNISKTVQTIRKYLFVERLQRTDVVKRVIRIV